MYIAVSEMTAGLTGLTLEFFRERWPHVISDHPRSQELLYYVGRVDVQQGKVSVGIHSFPAKQPPFALQDADYAVAWKRISYRNSCPLLRVLGLNMYV